MEIIDDLNPKYECEKCWYKYSRGTVCSVCGYIKSEWMYLEEIREKHLWKTN